MPMAATKSVFLILALIAVGLISGFWISEQSTPTDRAPIPVPVGQPSVVQPMTKSPQENVTKPVAAPVAKPTEVATPKEKTKPIEAPVATPSKSAASSTQAKV